MEHAKQSQVYWETGYCAVPKLANARESYALKVDIERKSDLMYYSNEMIL